MCPRESRSESARAVPVHACWLWRPKGLLHAPDPLLCSSDSLVCCLASLQYPRKCGARASYNVIYRGCSHRRERLFSTGTRVVGLHGCGDCHCCPGCYFAEAGFLLDCILKLYTA